MDKEQAINLIKQAVEAYRGSLQEHTALQQAMQVITGELNAKTQETKTKVEKKEDKS